MFQHMALVGLVKAGFVDLIISQVPTLNFVLSFRLVFYPMSGPFSSSTQTPDKLAFYF
jgi:hypothetical protein